MQSLITDYIFLILAIILLVTVAERLKLAYPIVLVVGGLALSLLPRLGRIIIEPHMIFFIFLPPLLYQTAWQVSWKEFWRWRRTIAGFAFPIVVITSGGVAVVSHAFIPGFSLALGFLLGGIVSPPDAISATSIMQRLKVSRTLLTLTEGESLLNDASSLIVVRFSIAALLTGSFVAANAATTFIVVITIGALCGVFIALIIYSIHRWLPLPTNAEILLTFATPYLMYFLAEHFGYSGVIAVVSGGLLLSRQRHEMFDYQSRVEAVTVWTSLVFVLNGLIFVLIGLQLPSIVNQLGEIGLLTAIGYGVLISVVLMMTRIVSALGASLLGNVAGRIRGRATPGAGWRNPLIFGWAGMRGVVSLAAALSIPLTIDRNVAFPQRDLILFITFVVIIVTLVVQGLTLPVLVHYVKPELLADEMTENTQQLVLQKRIASAAIDFLNNEHSAELRTNRHLITLSQRLHLELQFLRDELKEIGDNSLQEFHVIYLDALARQRTCLDDLNLTAEFDESLIRKYHSLIDMEELRIRGKQLPDGTPS